MKMHLNPGYEDNRCRYIRKHCDTGCHIIGLVTHKTLNHNDPHIRCPEYEVMNIKPQNIQEIGCHQLPPFPEIFQHRLIAAAVFDKIPFHCSKLHDSNEEESDHQ